MKRIAIILVLCLCSLLCSCHKTAPSQTDSTEQTTLIRSLTATEQIENIDSVEIHSEMCAEPILITDKKDLTFLQKYTADGDFPADRLHELYIYPPYCTLTVTVNGFEETLHLLEDGGIAKKVMCGDSGVPEAEKSYEIYTADRKYRLTEERLTRLLEKYGG